MTAIVHAYSNPSVALPLTPTIAKLRSLPQNRNRRPQAAPKGQPKLTKALAQRFCDLVASTDKSLFTLCDEYPDLPHHKSLFNWQARVPWFADMWKQARIRQTHFLVQKCLDLAKSAEPKTAHVVRVQFDIYRFIAAKFNPDTYGEKSFQPAQTTVNVGISIPAERLSELRSKLGDTRNAFVPVPGKNTSLPLESASPTYSNGGEHPKRDVTSDSVRNTPNGM